MSNSKQTSDKERQTKCGACKCNLALVSNSSYKLLLDCTLYRLSGLIRETLASNCSGDLDKLTPDIVAKSNLCPKCRQEGSPGLVGIASICKSGSRLVFWLGRYLNDEFKMLVGMQNKYRHKVIAR